MRELRAYYQHLLADPTKDSGSVSNQFTGISSLYDYLASEGIIERNIVPDFRRRYLRLTMREASKKRFERKPCMTVAQVRRLVRSMSDVQDRLLVVMAAKTGGRAGELVAIDVADIDWRSQSIRFKPNPRRTHLLGFFDTETARLLRKWLPIRATWTKDAMGPLFLADSGRRLDRNQTGKRIAAAARRIGLVAEDGESLKRITPHMFRHWFTTQLHRAEMKREHIKILRGDKLPETMDIYLHIEYDDLRREYLRCIPLIAGGPKPPRERSRERRARNATFGFLTPQEASRPRGKQPGKSTLELRKMIAADLAAGRLKRPKEYTAWLMAQGPKSLNYARHHVTRQLRLLGVPSLQKGPHGKGWKVARKALRYPLRSSRKQPRGIRA